jgi:tetratricopeptide repeat protein 30
MELSNFPRSRAALSLLGYCYYHVCDYNGAAQCYEQLIAVCPDVEEYKIYYSQSLLKAGMFADSTRVAVRVTSEQFSQRLLMLQATIKYEQDELASSKALLDQCISDDPDVLINYAAIAFKEGKFEEARNQYLEAINTMGYQPDLAYNIALSYYREKLYGPALKFINEIIEKGVRSHPELSVGSNTDGIEVRSVGNSAVLRETALIEAFNLKAAIEYQMRSNEPAKVSADLKAAKDALTDMPPRNESELDPVTLHNQALIHCDDDPTSAFRKFSFLLANPPYPPETFGNLLLLHCKYQNYELAAGLLAENSHLTFKFLSTELYDFLEASIMLPTSIEESYRKFDDLSARYIDKLRKLTKLANDSRHSKNGEQTKVNLKLYDEELDKYIPVLMAQVQH